MTYAEFCGWAKATYDYDLHYYHDLVERRAIWPGGYDKSDTGTGTGHPADYTIVHQRRFAFWLRARDWLGASFAHTHLYQWLELAESYDTGWLVNDGQGVRWIEKPEEEALELVTRGFVAVKCGL